MNASALDGLPAGRFPDPLPPLPPAGAALPAAATTAFWLDIAVPEGAPAAVHPFGVRLLGGGGGTVVGGVLRVFNFSVAGLAVGHVEPFRVSHAAWYISCVILHTQMYGAASEWLYRWPVARRGGACVPTRA